MTMEPLPFWESVLDTFGWVAVGFAIGTLLAAIRYGSRIREEEEKGERERERDHKEGRHSR